MPANVTLCARLLAEQGLRHHLDGEEGVIRVVFLTRAYRNPRGERLLIVSVETPDDGQRLQARVRFACPQAADRASVCLLACRLAAEVPLVGFELDAEADEFWLVSEMPVLDGTVTSRQLLALIDGVAAAAEQWQILVDRHPTIVRRVGIAA
jgi:hypothetical protein